MLTNRRFQVFMGSNKSRWRTLSDDLTQGSVLSPILFNLYMHDVPQTTCKQFWFADDLELVFQCSSFEEGEMMLSTDFIIIKEFLDKWSLKINT